MAELKKSGVLRPKTKVRTSKYLNNLVEQDHRRIKQRIYPMLGFKNFFTSMTTITGIELTQKIKQRQFDIEKFTGGVQGASAISVRSSTCRLMRNLTKTAL